MILRGEDKNLFVCVGDWSLPPVWTTSIRSPFKIAKARGSRRELVLMIEHTEEYVIEGKLAFNEEDRWFSDLNLQKRGIQGDC